MPHVSSPRTPHTPSQAGTVISPSPPPLCFRRAGGVADRASAPHTSLLIPYLVRVLVDLLIETFHHPPKIRLKLHFDLFTATHIEQSRSGGGSLTPLAHPCRRLSGAVTQALLPSRPATGGSYASPPANPGPEHSLPNPHLPRLPSRCPRMSLLTTPDYPTSWGPLPWR